MNLDPIHAHPGIRRGDRRRGHRFVPPAATCAAIPSLYGTEDLGLADKTLHVHYFAGACDWWIAELGAPEVDGSDVSWLAWGFADLGDSQCAEWGYIDLVALATTTYGQQLDSATFPAPIERDLYWTPITFADLNR